jgi:plasmid stability protein
MLCMQIAIIGLVNVQIRDVPDDVHRRLRSQAALAGQSLNEFLQQRLDEIARTPTVGELAERIRARGSVDLPPSADIVRAEREHR